MIRPRVARVVWLAAVVTADGETLLEAVPQSEAVARAVAVAPDGTLTTDVARLLDAILSDGTDADRAWVAARHRDYPHHALIEPGRLSAFLELGIPTGYVVAAQDRTIVPELARTFAARLPAASVLTVDAGHDAMITAPLEVADALESMA
jgi:pimeloyl-ACP methyl ester carboxylesterase